MINFSCQSLTPTPHFGKYRDLTPKQKTHINKLVDESFNNIKFSEWNKNYIYYVRVYDFV